MPTKLETIHSVVRGVITADVVPVVRDGPSSVQGLPGTIHFLYDL